MKFTFKQEKPTGRYRSFHATTYLIKLKSRQCGFFFEKFSDPIQITLSIYKDLENDDGNENCEWMNITFKKEFKTVDEAKAFLIKNTDKIVKRYNLYFN